MSEQRILTGNEACTLGALAAGMDFFAGYPITPATEIAELSSELLPKSGGKYIQMEDELGSIAAVIGASFAGARAMTATSGPGFSLMQENLSYGMLAEVPCVLIDVMRQGPCQGVATLPAQGDLMQARWGTHGDHPVIALAPASVAEAYDETARAFYLAERFRTPVVVLSDAVLAHMSEKVTLAPLPEERKYRRKRPSCPPEEYRPYHDDGTGVPPMAVFGDGYRWYVSGIIHDETGFPVANRPDVIERKVGRLLSKIGDHLDEVEKWEEYRTEDAELLVVAVGTVARTARAAVEKARAAGIKAGLFRPVTLWPFPEARLRALAEKAGRVLTCEMNEGQLCGLARQYCAGAAEVRGLTQNNGRLLEPGPILSAIREVTGK